MKKGQLSWMPPLVLCLWSMPAMEGSILFSDLGPPGNVYNGGSGWTVGGSTGVGNGQSWTAANLFTVSGSGSLSVSQIDLAVTNVGGRLDTFYASIWTDNSGLPGIQVASADWNLVATSAAGTCCGLVTVSGISRVNLTGGQQYFLVVGPLSLSDDSYNPLNVNNQGVTGLDLFSNNGGSSWTSNGNATLGAFDVLSTPEPGSLLLLGTGLIGMLGAYRRKSNR